jgi:hypothetical protein
MQLPEKYKENFDVSSPSPGDKTKTIQDKTRQDKNFIDPFLQQ